MSQWVIGLGGVNRVTAAFISNLAEIFRSQFGFAENLAPWRFRPHQTSNFQIAHPQTYCCCPGGGVGGGGWGRGGGANFAKKNEKVDTKKRPTPEIWAFLRATTKR